MSMKKPPTRKRRRIRKRSCHLAPSHDRGLSGNSFAATITWSFTMSRHLMRGRQLSRDTEHRKAMRRNLVQSLFEHGKVRTTLPKAKEVKAMAERLITLARQNTVNNRRRVIALMRDRRLVDEEQ